MLTRTTKRGFTAIELVIALIVVCIVVGIGTAYIKKRMDDRDTYWEKVASWLPGELMSQQPLTPRKLERMRRVLDMDIVNIEVYRVLNDLDRLKRRDPRTCECASLLGAAIYTGKLEAAQLLIDEGADPNGIEYDERKIPPPLFWAAAGGHPGAVELLLDSGADPKSVSSGYSLLEWADLRTSFPDIRVKLLPLVEGKWLRAKQAEMEADATTP